MSVLVAYASAFGSTREIAERIGEVIGKSVPGVEVRSIDQVSDLAAYDAFVLGSAVHNQAWLPAGEDFVRRNAPRLAGKPLWMFSVGMPAALPAPLRRMAMSEEAKLRAQFSALAEPIEHRLFSGVITPECISVIGRVLFFLLGGRYGDHRNWPAIEAWAEGIGRALAKSDTEHSRSDPPARRSRQPL